MKQTKKMSRRQRLILQRHNIDVEGVRIYNETKDFIEYVTSDGVHHRLDLD